MRIRFTKMQGAGNDFVVLDETRGRLNLTTAQYRLLADRHFGVGADQILSVRPSPAPGIDFAYAIHNADGAEVEHCGNGARCFVRYVRENGLSDKRSVRVQTVNRVLDLHMGDDGRVTVDMGEPVFDVAHVPFDGSGMQPVAANGWQLWPLAGLRQADGTAVQVAVLSMGNPHAVLQVDDVDRAPVPTLGPQIESHAAFARRVNAGFMQVLSRSAIRLRVYERGAGETLACGTGACAAVAAGIRLGWLDARVDVHTRGGLLTIEWSGAGTPVRMTGPAVTVFEGEIDLPDAMDLPDA
ncbi:MAG: putative Diaminopimelate epimerase [Pseudomonadota bacterium]